jgi:hypothetical protein
MIWEHWFLNLNSWKKATKNALAWKVEGKTNQPNGKEACLWTWRLCCDSCQRCLTVWLHFFIIGRWYKMMSISYPRKSSHTLSMMSEVGIHRTARQDIYKPNNIWRHGVLFVFPVKEISSSKWWHDFQCY